MTTSLENLVISPIQENPVVTLPEENPEISASEEKSMISVTLEDPLDNFPEENSVVSLTQANPVVSAPQENPASRDFGPVTYGKTKFDRICVIFDLPEPAKDTAYVFSKQKSFNQTLYYRCDECTRLRVGKTKIPTIRVKNNRYMDDPAEPRNPHFCFPIHKSSIAATQLDRHVRSTIRETRCKPRHAYEEAVKAIDEMYPDDELLRTMVKNSYPQFKSVRSAYYRCTKGLPPKAPGQRPKKAVEPKRKRSKKEAQTFGFLESGAEVKIEAEDGIEARMEADPGPYLEFPFTFTSNLQALPSPQPTTPPCQSELLRLIQENQPLPQPAVQPAAFLPVFQGSKVIFPTPPFRHPGIPPPNLEINQEVLLTKPMHSEQGTQTEESALDTLAPCAYCLRSKS